MNGHERARQLAAFAIDFPLSALERRELDDHLESCVSCRSFEAGMRFDASSLRSIARQPAPMRLRETVAASALVAGPDRRLTLAFQLAWVLVLTGLLVAALTGALIMVGGHTPPIVPKAPLGLQLTAIIDAPAGVISGEDPPGPHPGGGSGGITGAAFGEDSVWVTTADGVQRIDPATNAVAATISLGAHPTGIAFGAGSVWISVTGAGLVARVDPATNAVLARIPVGRQPVGIAFGHNSVWAALWVDKSLVRIDPATNLVVATIPVATSPLNVAVTSSAIWVTGSSGSGFAAQSSALRIDPSTNSVTSSASIGSVDVLVADGDKVWLLGGNGVSRLDVPISPIPVHNGATGLALGGGSLWVFSSQGFVERIHLAANAVADQVAFSVPPGPPWAVSGTYGAGSAWARVYDSGSVLRIDSGP